MYPKGNAMASTAQMTADEYLALPYVDGEHSELIDGEIVMNSPRSLHQYIITWLAIEIGLWIRGGPSRGRVSIEVDHKLNDLNVFAPDLWWRTSQHIAEHRAGVHGGDAKFNGPPELAVEVRSERTWKCDTGVKLRTYESSGLLELWLVDTKSNTVIVHRRSDPKSPLFDVVVELRAVDASVLTTPLMPGLQLDVATLFDQGD
jgi:Uma2 family endonuclease